MNIYNNIDQLKHELKSKQTLKDFIEIEMMIKKSSYEALTNFENALVQERKKQVNQFLIVNEEKLDNLNTVIDLIREQKKIMRNQLSRNAR